MFLTFFPGFTASVLTGMGVVALTMSAAAQTTAPAGAAAPATGAAAPVDATAQMSNDVPVIPEKKTKGKDDKVVQSKDTKKAMRKESKEKKANPLLGEDAKLPDKQLFDKATEATKHGHYDVARLDLQTLLNTYPDSQYQMQAKLAIADSWYREGGTAALTQAESEYADFRVFFPNAPEAAEAQMRIGDIYFRQMDKPDRDYAKAVHAEEEYRRMLTDYPDSTLVPAAQQRLREVQEALATREAAVAEYYASRNNWPATIARFKTVVGYLSAVQPHGRSADRAGRCVCGRGEVCANAESAGGSEVPAGADVRWAGSGGVSHGGAGALCLSACG